MVSGIQSPRFWLRASPGGPGLSVKGSNQSCCVARIPAARVENWGEPSSRKLIGSPSAIAAWANALGLRSSHCTADVRTSKYVERVSFFISNVYICVH